MKPKLHGNKGIMESSGYGWGFLLDFQEKVR